MLCKTPKTFDTVDMILGATINKGSAVADRVVFAQTLQGVVAPECVRVVDRPLSGFLPNDGHEFLFGHMLHDPRVHLPITLQKAQYNVFTGCTPSATCPSSCRRSSSRPSQPRRSTCRPQVRPHDISLLGDADTRA